MDILPQLLVNSLIAGSIYALASSGLSLTYGMLRILNFAHGHLMMAGAYTFYFWHVEQGWGLPGAALLSAVSVLLLGVFCLKVFILPFTAYSYALSFVTTLALGTVLESAVSIFFGVNVKSLTVGMDISSIKIAGVYITPTQILIVSSAAGLLSLLAFLIHFTPLGRMIRGLSEHTHAAESIGISKSITRNAVFLTATLLAAYAGVMVGIETNMQPTMGGAYTMKAFAAMTLGGLGNVWGTIAGSYILGLVENLSIGLEFWGYSLPAGYKDAFSFAIILAVLLYRPRGLFLSAPRAA